MRTRTGAAPRAPPFGGETTEFTVNVARESDTHPRRRSTTIAPVTTPDIDAAPPPDPVPTSVFTTRCRSVPRSETNAESPDRVSESSRNVALNVPALPLPGSTTSRVQLRPTLTRPLGKMAGIPANAARSSGLTPAESLGASDVAPSRAIHSRSGLPFNILSASSADSGALATESVMATTSVPDASVSVGTVRENTISVFTIVVAAVSPHPVPVISTRWS